MELQIQLYGRPAARLTLEPDPLSWLKMWPVEVHELWERLSVATWEPPQQSPAIGPWFEGLLPEGLSREPFARVAEQRIGGGPDHSYSKLLASQLWANAAWDYPGAVEFSGAERSQVQTGFDPVSEHDIGRLLHDARIEREMRGRAVMPESRVWRPSALTGMRGKLVVEPTKDGWALPVGDAKGRWIVKHEDREHLPGEAGVEAVMQRTMGYLGIRAARTRSRVMGEVQCVLSERADRYLHEGEVRTRHQEDFLQATGWPSTAKYWEPESPDAEPGYPELFEILTRHALRPEYEQDQLLRVVAAAVLTGNGDMHRRNLGVSHPLLDEQGVTLAPLYDAGAFPGVEPVYRGQRYAPARLALPVGQTVAFDKVAVTDWRALANASNLDPDWVLTTVRRVGAELPDAVAQACQDAHHQDENRAHHQAAVDRRLNAVSQFIQEQTDRFNDDLAGSGAGAQVSNVAAVGDALYEASRGLPGGRVRGAVSPQGTVQVLWIVEPDGDRQGQEIECGRVADGAELARAMVWAQLKDRDEVAELERTLEQERARELKQLRQRTL